MIAISVTVMSDLLAVIDESLENLELNDSHNLSGTFSTNVPLMFLSGDDEEILGATFP